MVQQQQDKNEKENQKNHSSKQKNDDTTTKVDAMEIDEETSFTKSEPIKGYKIVNGKKTSYFHNELSEEAAKLIGDIAPKKLTENNGNNNNNNNGSNIVGSGKNNNDTITTTDGTSAWNKAGTWEERDVTTWAIETIEKQLQSVQYTLPESSPAPNATVHTKKVTKTRIFFFYYHLLSFPFHIIVDQLFIYICLKFVVDFVLLVLCLSSFSLLCFFFPLPSPIFIFFSFGPDFFSLDFFLRKQFT